MLLIEIKNLRVKNMEGAEKLNKEVRNWNLHMTPQILTSAPGDGMNSKKS